jgi:hypothetical protein
MLVSRWFYLAIDTFGLLAAPFEATNASRTTFIRWCEKYIVGRLEDRNGNPIAALDLYAARCGILHTSTPESDLSRKRDAHEVAYFYCGKMSFRVFMVTPLPLIGIEIEQLAWAFKEGAVSFITDVNTGDPLYAHQGHNKAENFMRRGIPANPSPAAG